MRRIWICLLQLALLPCLLHAQTKAPSSGEKSARAFVEEFYGWYGPKALVDNPRPAWEIAIESRTASFSGEIIHGLRENAAAQKRSPGEIVGLDFDPFLNSQDPCEKYEIGGCSRVGNAFRFGVYGVVSGSKHAKPDVFAEVVRDGTNWKFKNFIYPEGADLLKTLKGIQAKGK